MCPDFKTNIKKALQHLRGTDSNQAAYLFILHNSATGDLAHIIPILRNPMIKVLVMGGLEDRQSDPVNGRMNLGEILVREFAVPTAQVARAVALIKGTDDSMDAAGSVSQVKTAAKSINLPFTEIFNLASSTKVIRWQFLKEDGAKVFGDPGKVPQAMSASLDITEGSGPDAISKAVRAGISGVNDDDGGAFGTILQTAKMTEFSKPLIVLWGRRTLKDTGAHYYGNHSDTGWDQIASTCLDKGYNILLAGQYKAEIKEKHASLKKCFYIGEFYKNPYMPRTKQICFFDYIGRKLKDNGKSYLHVGMRSGGLDLYGFAGQPILYIAYEKEIEDFENKGTFTKRFDERIGNLTEALHNSGMQTYNRIPIGQPPKRWTTEDGVKAKKDNERKKSEEAKGFQKEDLNKILSDIQRLLPA